MWGNLGAKHGHNENLGIYFVWEKFHGPGILCAILQPSYTHNLKIWYALAHPGTKQVILLALLFPPEGIDALELHLIKLGSTPYPWVLHLE